MHFGFIGGSLEQRREVCVCRVGWVDTGTFDADWRAFAMPLQFDSGRYFDHMATELCIARLCPGSGAGVDLAFEDAYICIMSHVEHHAQRKDSFQSADRSRCVGKCHLNDGTTIRFRPIEPTDVSAYRGMLSLCSPKSLYSRYERLVTATPQEMAEELCGQASYCNLTLVAEIIGDGSQSIIGAAQLLANQGREAAEYAVLVCDPWQGKGLGGAFTSFCLKIARARGIGRVIAEFLPDNMRMIRILEAREFDLQRDPQENVVSGQKVID